MRPHPNWYRCELESGDPAIRFPADSPQDAADRVGRIFGEEVVDVVSLDLDPMPRLLAAGYREQAPRYASSTPWKGAEGIRPL